MARVLLWEDDDALCQLLREALELEGHTVACCATPADVLRQAGAADVAVVDGFGSLTALDADTGQQLRTLATVVPTLLLSGRRWATPEQAAELGLVAALPKPFDLADLLSVIDRVTTGLPGSAFPSR